jgi:hypothetical protein
MHDCKNEASEANGRDIMAKESKGKKLRYQSLIEEFMAAREWTDELEVNLEERTTTLDTGIDLAGQGGRLIIQGADETDFLDVHIYFEFQCRAAKLEQMAILLNEIHKRWKYGHFTCFDDGHVRWSHRVDFEGSSPTATNIERIVKPGWGVAAHYIDPIAAVALTKQDAKEAIAEFDEEQEKRSAKTDDGPSEL